MKKRRFDIRTMCFVGIMAALVFVGTNFRIKIPVGMDGTMLHLGNVFCLLAGLLFGGLPGGLAAGFGSALFDLLSEYAAEAWITFINKFFMGLVAGLVMQLFRRGSEKVRAVVSAACGSLTYCVLYIAKNIIEQRFVYGLDWTGIWAIVGVKTAVTLTNGVVAVIASTILYLVLKPLLVKAKLLD